MCEHTVPEQGALVLHINAPLQSWGVGAQGTVRSTNAEPTLSGMVGLIGNAMARTRDDDISDLAALPMGVRVDRPGVLTRDFFTAGTTTGVVQREESIKGGRRVFRDRVVNDGAVGTKFYLSGAAFTVALQVDREFGERIAAALARPARALFLGRKSCPVTFMDRAVWVPGTLEEVLRTFPLDLDLLPDPERPWAGRGVVAPARLTLVLPAGPDEVGAQPRKDVPVSFTREARRYATRFVRFAHVDRDTLTVQDSEEESA
ncbi:type I-E CRISPR-associated protein Cas5/CasD [Micrococcus luteus]